MIRVEKGTCDIKTSEGVPGLMADLAVIVRTLKKTLTEKCDQSEAEAKEVINRAVELGLVTDAELESEAFKVVGEFLTMLMNNSSLREGCVPKGGVIMEKKPLIIRCSDGWIYGLFGYYEEAVEVAEQHIDGTEHTYIII